MLIEIEIPDLTAEKTKAVEILGMTIKNLAKIGGDAIEMYLEDVVSTAKMKLVENKTLDELESIRE